MVLSKSTILRESLFVAIKSLEYEALGKKEGWISDDYGWQYVNQDGSLATKKWKQIDGVWYHFNDKA